MKELDSLLWPQEVQCGTGKGHISLLGCSTDKLLCGHRETCFLQKLVVYVAYVCSLAPHASLIPNLGGLLPNITEPYVPCSCVKQEMQLLYSYARSYVHTIVCLFVCFSDNHFLKFGPGRPLAPVLLLISFCPFSPSFVSFTYI